MNSLIVFAAVVAIASAGLVPVSQTTVVEGPSSSASVVGPDGSAIVSAQPAGRIVSTENVGGAAVGYSAPVVATPIAAAPAVPYGGHYVARSIATPWVAGSIAAPWAARAFVNPWAYSGW